MFYKPATHSGKLTRFTLDGECHQAPAGISVAAALLSISQISCSSAVSGQPRGPYCMMGVCFDCLMCIDGEPNQQACMVMLQEDMRVETQDGARKLDLKSGTEDE